jgi:hypothetical protein
LRSPLVLAKGTHSFRGKAGIGSNGMTLGRGLRSATGHRCLVQPTKQNQREENKFERQSAKASSQKTRLNMRLTSLLTHTLFDNLEIECTSLNMLPLSPRTRIWSPGTIFHHLILLSSGTTSRNSPCGLLSIFITFFEMGSRCRKFFVHGTVVTDV